MRKIIGTLVCLWISLQLSAAGYQPMTYSAPETGFRSTSAYTVNSQRTSGFAAISASNYAALNSEGGACYSGPRKGRPKPGDYGGTGAIGNYDFHSPVGDVPWEMMVIFALILAYIKKKQYFDQLPKRGPSKVRSHCRANYNLFSIKLRLCKHRRF